MTTAPETIPAPTTPHPHAVRPVRPRTRYRGDEIEIVRGFLWHVAPESPEAVHRWVDDTEGELHRDGDYGYHGTDVWPCGASWAADHEDGYLVITGTDVVPVCADGWTIERADVDEGDVIDDGTCATTILAADKLAEDEDGNRVTEVTLAWRTR